MEKISGCYTHYKGKAYEVYCAARDEGGEQYVLYQQCYDDNAFWVRPYDMFFDSVKLGSRTVQRFAPNDAERLTSAGEYLKKIIRMSEAMRIRHTETEQEVAILRIDEATGEVILRLL